MVNRLVATLSAAALALSVGPVQADDNKGTKFALFSFKDGFLVEEDSWRSSYANYSECTSEATWMRNKLKLNTPTSAVFCVRWNWNYTGVYPTLYITGPGTNIYKRNLTATMSQCRSLASKITTQLRNRTKYKTWIADCQYWKATSEKRRKKSLGLVKH